MIFISYRHSDSRDACDRIYSQLREAFGAANVFRDIDTMPFGVDWREFVQLRIEASQVVLAIIGPRWTNLKGDDGVRRLELATDPIRVELESALRSGRRIIPLAVSGAGFPKAPDLPDPLKRLESIVGLSIRSDPDFRNDMLRLIEDLRKHLPSDGTSAAPVAVKPATSSSFSQAVREFIDGFRTSYQPYEPRRAELADPAKVYVPLTCTSQHDYASPPADALDWLCDGIAEGKAQLVLSDYGTGKSFLALELQRRLAEAFYRDPDAAPIPILFPLKLHRRRNRPDGIAEDLFDFLQQRGFPVSSYAEFQALLQAGRLCVILDAVDEIPLVQTCDPHKTPQILERLDLRRFGPCAWVATSRTGLFSAALPELREKRPYRLAYLLKWGAAQWRRYVYLCDDRLKLFGDDEAREAFLELVDRSPRLRELTTTPLLARMLIESWPTIRSTPERVNLIGLYRSYTDYILEAKQDESVLADLETRRQCLEAAALHFFRSQTLSCPSDELLKIADGYLCGVGKRDLSTFIRIELQTYSLLVCDRSSGALGFSHKSFYEFFLATAVMREVLARGMGDSRLLQKRLDAGEIGFVAALSAEPERQDVRSALERLLHEDTSLRDREFRRNLVQLALATARCLDDGAGTDRSGFAPLVQADLKEIEISGLDFSSCDLQNADLSGAAAVGVNFSGAVMRDCNFTGANLTACNLGGADLRGAALDFCTIAELVHSEPPPLLTGCTFRGINVSKRDAAYLNYAIACDPEGDEK